MKPVHKLLLGGLAILVISLVLFFARDADSGMAGPPLAVSFSPAQAPNHPPVPTISSATESVAGSADAHPATKAVLSPAPAGRTFEGLQTKLTSLQAELGRLEVELASGKRTGNEKPGEPGAAKSLAQTEQDKILRQAKLNEEISTAKKRYRDFAKETGLNAEDMTQLTQMIGEHELEMSLVAKSTYGNSYHVEYQKYPKMDFREREKIEKELKAVFVRNVKAFLGPQRYEEYENFNRTYFPRHRLGAIETNLEKAGLNLEGTLRERIVGLIKENHATLEAKIAPIPKGKERWERHKQEANAMDLQFREQIKAMLNPNQRAVVDGMEFKRWYD